MRMIDEDSNKKMKDRRRMLKIMMINKDQAMKQIVSLILKLLFNSRSQEMFF